MQFLKVVVALAVGAIPAEARVGQAFSFTLAEPAGLGEACGDAEYERFKTIVCELREACGCKGVLCEQEWCNSYMSKWKKEFGACTAKGCPLK
eukprot:Skav233389  [mRNA]  locus=scaffold1038:189713:193544:+ [translate_table: standard]